MTHIASRSAVLSGNHIIMEGGVLNCPQHNQHQQTIATHDGENMNHRKVCQNGITAVMSSATPLVKSSVSV